MENEDEVALSSNPNPNLLATDQSLEKRHQSMLNRLSNRHQTQLDSSLTCRSADLSSSPSFESTSTFLSRFSNSKSSIKLVAENSYFLPFYEVRSLLKTTSDLRQSLEVLSPELLPFSFRNKPTKKDPITEPKEEEKVQEPEKKSSFRVPDSPKVGESSILNLDSCEVRLMGSVRALFVHRLRNCRVYTSLLIGSVSIDGVEGCVFVMASHQIRIHNAKTSDFYLKVKSWPIIKDSCGVRFAPYYLTYKGIEKELREASLDEETEKWSNVDDFLWLRAI
ncbi:unnamed protein product [Malus baccata var. baccata]